jgi:hypothetical protein
VKTQYLLANTLYSKKVEHRKMSKICADQVKEVSRKYGVSLPTAHQYLKKEQKRNELLERITVSTNLDDLKEVLSELVRETYPSFTIQRGNN